MRIPKDLTEADLASRLHLGYALRTRRLAANITTRDLGTTLGISDAAVRGTELRSSWQARTVMRYARGIGHQIRWSLVGLVVPDDDDVMAVIYDTISTEQVPAEQADKNHWRTLCNDLCRIRRHCLTTTAMSKRLNIKTTAVHYWETNPDGSSVIAAQRHARALGGHLTWNLLPAAAGTHR